MPCDGARTGARFQQTVSAAHRSRIQLLDKLVIDVAVVSPSWLRQGEIMARYQREIAIQEAIRQQDVIIAHDEILKVVQVNLLEKLIQQEEFW